jgi:hypothetical protein
MAERKRHRHGSRESGVALVEAALVLVVVVALLAGVSAVSGEWGEQTRTEQLVTRAARLAARHTDPVTSDLDVLALVGGGLGAATLERLVVYRPVGVDGAPPPACVELRPTGTVPAGVVGACTAFGPGHLEALAGAPVSARGCGPGSWEVTWCPATRRTTADAPGWIGILLDVRGPDGATVSSGAGAIRRSARAVAAVDPPPPGRP